jgi:hypothetical protein
MSLKAFHIVFVTASVLLCLGVGWLSLDRYLHNGSVLDLFYGLGSFLVGGILVYYGKLFLRKLKRISYL